MRTAGVVPGRRKVIVLSKMYGYRVGVICSGAG